MDANAKCQWCGKAYEQHVDVRRSTDPVPRMPCVGLKAYFLEEKPKMDEAFKLDPKDREAAHRAVDRWIAECEHEADHAYEDGRSGYLGRIKLCAFVDDEGLSLRVERSVSEDL